jgi:solute carrier family 44 (choline transporter-like protein), member 2/4/5
MGGPLGAIIGRYPSAAGEDELGAAGGGVIRHNRRCRDITFLVLFAAFWVAMIVNSSFGFNQGNPLRSARPCSDSVSPFPFSFSQDL